MAKTREIKKRLKAVGNIKRITRTMQMIATSKFSKAQQHAVASKPYTSALLDLVAELSQAEGADHPLLSGVPEAADQPELTLILSSDRGLCGPYNGSILRVAARHLRNTPAALDGPIEVVGKKGVSMLKFNGFNLSQHHQQFGDKPPLDLVSRLADSYAERYLAGEISAIRVIYMKYISAGKQRPEVLQLLPFAPPPAEDPEAAIAEAAGKPKTAAGGGTLQFEFSPSEAELLGRIVPAAVRTVLYQCFNDAVVSEHIARMIAMKAATDNAGKMGKALKTKFNRARQAQITTELTEIISGAAALE